MAIEIKEGDKVAVLLALLAERYNALHVIRKRAEVALLASLGANGFILSLVFDKAPICSQQKGAFTVLAFLLGLGGWLVLDDLFDGFKKCQQVTAKVESALGCYQDGIFTTDALFPVAWQNAGTEKGKGFYFKLLLTIHIVGAGITMALVWFLG